MTRFDPYSAVYGAHTPASLGNVLADAERGGFEVEPRWIVTTMGPIRATSIHEPDGWTGEGRRWIEVSIPCPLAPAGRHDWGTARPNYAAAEPDISGHDAEVFERILDSIRTGVTPPPSSPYSGLF